jgi:hypothetical protein
MTLASALKHMFLALSALVVFGCADDDCTGDWVTGANGASTCLVYSEPSDDRPCGSRDAAECERGGRCILDQVCIPTACSGDYCGTACEMRTACLPYD